MTSPPKPTADELEAAASQHLGQLLFIFGTLEMNMGLALANSHSAELAASVVLKIECHSFGKRLTMLRQRVEAKYCDDAEVPAVWNAWYLAADSLRTLRNRFAHGRWGFAPSQQQIAHVTGLPGSPNQIETRYTLSQLALAVENAQQVSVDFSRLRHQSPELF